MEIVQHLWPACSTAGLLLREGVALCPVLSWFVSISSCPCAMQCWIAWLGVLGSLPKVLGAAVSFHGAAQTQLPQPFCTEPTSLSQGLCSAQVLPSSPAMEWSEKSISMKSLSVCEMVFEVQVFEGGKKKSFSKNKKPLWWSWEHSWKSLLSATICHAS